MTLQNFLQQLTPQAQTTDANSLQQMLNQFQQQNAPATGQTGTPTSLLQGQNLLPVDPQQLAGPGANENQLQGGAQSGAYASQGTTGQFGQTAGAQTGQTATQGTTTTGVNDTLGMGSLLQSQQPTAANTAANTNATLTGLMQQGNPALQQQVGQAVNQALSGPGMQGVGQGAQARAAGDAAAQIGMNSAGTQLQAAQQLSGPTAATTLATAANPYLGSTQTSANTGTTGQTSTGTSNTVGAQNTSGTASGSNIQQAEGLTPQQSSSSGGGSIICTALGERGMLPRWMLQDELFFVQQNWARFRHAARFYFIWGTPVAKLVRRFSIVAYLCFPLAWGCAYEASRRAKIQHLKVRLLPLVAYYIFLISNTVIGRCIPGEPRVKDPELVKMLKAAGLNLENL